MFLEHLGELRERDILKLFKAGMKPDIAKEWNEVVGEYGFGYSGIISMYKIGISLDVALEYSRLSHGIASVACTPGDAIVALYEQALAQKID